MKFVLFSILAFSLNTFAATPGCVEYSGSFTCTPVKDNGMQPKTKSFSVKDGVLTMNINEFETSPRVYTLDGKTRTKTNTQGDVIDTSAYCKTDEAHVSEVIKVMGYERDLTVTYYNPRQVKFLDVTISNSNGASYSYEWNCINSSLK